MINTLITIAPTLIFIWSTYTLRKAVDKKEYGSAIQEGFWAGLCMILISIQMFIAGIKAMNRDIIFTFINFLDKL